MKKTISILLISRAHTLFATAVIVLLASCSKAELQQENNAEPPESGSMYAVSYDEAVAELESLLADIDTPTKGKTPRKAANYYTTTLSGAETKSNIDDPFIYIFNFENNEGFAILSGDKRTTPVYAITESGSLNPGDTITNPGLGIALMGIYDDIWGTIDKDPPGDIITFTHSAWRNQQDFGQAINAKWHQHNPYNKFCPNKYPVGCVAVAVGQIMYHYGYPPSYNGYIFDWPAIKQPELQHGIYEYDMIARLMQQLGLPNNLDMAYGTNSYAYNYNIPRTFQNFGFSYGGHIENYSFDIIKSQISSGKPVILSGDATRVVTTFPFYRDYYEDGHAWVADRVRIRERTTTSYRNGIFESQFTSYQHLVHCNWGWGWEGDYNGYFYSGVFDAINGRVETSTKTAYGDPLNFQFNVKMIINITK